MDSKCFQETFDIKPESEDFVLKSAGTKWRQFKADLTRNYVMPHIENKKKLSKPPKQYAFVGRGPWRRFVAERRASSWKVHIYIMNLGT